MLTTLLLAATSILAPNDSALYHHDLGEVVVVAERAEGSRRSAKGSVASIDEHLQELSHIDLIRRGSYASEAVVNNMSTERLSTTIDGMKIFYACTDKMDPVTSYVESGNLQSISLNTGLEGNPQSTGNIGGSLDLKLRRVGFDQDPFLVEKSCRQVVGCVFGSACNRQVCLDNRSCSEHLFLPVSSLVPVPVCNCGRKLGLVRECWLDGFDPLVGVHHVQFFHSALHTSKCIDIHLHGGVF